MCEFIWEDKCIGKATGEYSYGPGTVLYLGDNMFYICEVWKEGKTYKATIKLVPGQIDDN